MDLETYREEADMEMRDAVNPRHYEGDGEITCEKAMRSMTAKAALAPTAAYWWGCAFKYLWRWPLKGGRKDLLKCHRCIDFLLEELEHDGRC